jgi:lipopolysaccharide biosynthesis glycosyltransferase
MNSCFVFSVDDGFVVPFEVTLFSLVKHNPWVVNFRIFVIYDAETLNEKNRFYLREKIAADYGIACTFLDCSMYLPENIDNFNFHHVSKAAFYRLFVSTIITSEFEKAIYLDSDILVVGDLFYLIDLILDFPIAAVKNYAASEEIRLFGDTGGSYFNSGILVFNLVFLREFDIQSKYLSLIKNDPLILQCWDQDVLNLIHQDQWIQLPWYFNVTRHMMESFRIINLNFYRKLDLSNIRIIHFDGPSKPWEPQSDRDFSSVWRSYYAQMKGKNHKSSSGLYGIIRFIVRFKKNLARFKRDLK